MTLLMKRRVIAARLESVAGTGVELTADYGAFLAYDASIQQNMDSEVRQMQGKFSPLGATLGAHLGTLNFSMELTGSGSGGAPVPGWADVLLPACGFVKATATFSPESTAPGAAGAGTKTITIGLFEDGVLKKLTGAMGNCKLTGEAGKRVMLEFEFQGVWNAPVDSALITPTYPTVSPLRMVSSAFTITEGSTDWTPKLSKFELDFGNELTVREDVSAAAGVYAALITGRRLNGTMDPESTLVATNDLYGDRLALTEKELSIVLGSVAGNIVTLAAPALQFIDPQEGDRNGMQVDEVAFQLNASSGDDELTITFS
jgi:hypothetical protein